MSNAYQAIVYLEASKRDHHITPLTDPQKDRLAELVLTVFHSEGASRFKGWCRLDLVSLLGASLKGRASHLLPNALHHILHLASEFMSDTTNDRGLYFDWAIVESLQGLVPESRNERRDDISAISTAYIKKWSQLKDSDPWMVKDYGNHIDKVINLSEKLLSRDDAHKKA